MNENEKIGLGVDFIEVMLETNFRSKREDPNALVIARLLLVFEWGFTTDEQEKGNELFWRKVKNQSLDEIYTVISRLVIKFKDMPDAKAKIVTGVIAITKLDGNYSDGEQSLVYTLGQGFGFSADDIERFAIRADDILNTLFWFANNNTFKR